MPASEANPSAKAMFPALRQDYRLQGAGFDFIANMAMMAAMNRFFVTFRRFESRLRKAG